MSNLTLNKSEFKALLLKLGKVNIPNTSTISDDIHLTANIATRESFWGYTYHHCFSVVVGGENYGDYVCETIKSSVDRAYYIYKELYNKYNK